MVLKGKSKTPVMTRRMYKLIPISPFDLGSRELLLANAQDFLISETQSHYS